MGNRAFERRRQTNLWLAAIGLIIGPAIGAIIVSFLHSQMVLQWLPTRMWAHSGRVWIAETIVIVTMTLHHVAKIQLLVWLLWKPKGPHRWPIGIALACALVTGTASQSIVQALGRWLFYFVDFASVVSTIHDQSTLWLVSLAWSICQLAILGTILRFTEPIVGIKLIDSISTDGRARSNATRTTWSIRGMMIATFFIALAITIYQALVYYQRISIDGDHVQMSGGWLSLALMMAYFVGSALLLWSAAALRAGGKSQMILGLLVCAIIVYGAAIVGLHGWMIAGSTGLGSRLVIFNIILPIPLAFLFHLWLFRKWEQAGYRLSVAK